MPNKADVIAARKLADDALQACDTYGGMVEDGRRDSVSLAIMLSGRAVCLELRAFAVAYEAADLHKWARRA